jgi:hypothetical protein
MDGRMDGWGRKRGRGSIKRECVRERDVPAILWNHNAASARPSPLPTPVTPSSRAPRYGCRTRLASEAERCSVNSWPCQFLCVNHVGMRVWRRMGRVMADSDEMSKRGKGERRRERDAYLARGAQPAAHARDVGAPPRRLVSDRVRRCVGEAVGQVVEEGYGGCLR